MNSIISSQSAERAPDREDWAQLQKRLNSDKKIKELKEDFKKLEQRLVFNEKTIEKLKEVIKKLESKNEEKVNSQNVEKLVSNTAEKLESKNEQKTITENVGQFERLSENDIEIVSLPVVKKQGNK